MKKNRCEKIRITTPDGHIIVLEVEKAAGEKESDQVIILTHGIGTNKTESGRFLRLSERLRAEGYDVIRFDLRGHGESPLPTSEFSVSGAVVDYRSVLDWARTNRWTKVAVIGSSFGGSVVLLERQMPVVSPIVCTVLLNPVLDYETTFLKPSLEWGKERFTDDAVARILQAGSAKLKEGFIASLRLLIELSIAKPYLSLSMADNPTIVFHGELDEKIPIQRTKELCSGLPNISLIIIPNTGHGFKEPGAEEIVHGQAISWIKSHN